MLVVSVGEAVVKWGALIGAAGVMDAQRVGGRWRYLNAWRDICHADLLMFFTTSRALWPLYSKRER